MNGDLLFILYLFGYPVAIFIIAQADGKGTLLGD